MKTLVRRTASLLGALALLGAAQAKGLPNYDLRLEQPVPLGRGQQAMEHSRTWRSLFSREMQVRWNPVTGLPRHLFVYGGTLTGPLPASPEKQARAFLQRNRNLLQLSSKALQELQVVHQATSPQSGVTHLILHQYHQGLPVFGCDFRFHFTSDRRLVSVGMNYQSLPPMNLTPRVSAKQALAAVVANVTDQAGFRPEIWQAEAGVTRRTIFAAGPFLQTHAAQLVIFPTRMGARLAWRVLFHKNSHERYLAVVDAKTGGILLRVNMVNTYSGLVFDEHPAAGPQGWRSFDGDPVASPAGWVDPFQSTTQGNNVTAQADWSDSDFTGARPQHDASGAFNYPFANAWEITGIEGSDWEAAVVNLFYINNVCHDYFYGLGFDEASGNFQRDNFGRGGFGGDPVQADAQDDVLNQRNNANFFTPPEGGNPLEWGQPRMQMYLFDDPFPRRDGSFDGDIMVHEFGHGVSNRLIGTLEDPFSLWQVQSGAMGEGWSDIFAALFYNDPVMGEYATGDTTKGIRNYALDNNPLVYDDIGYGSSGPEVHDDGEIWSATLWDLRTRLVNTYGLQEGTWLAALLVTEGMKFTPGHPSFLDARDGILLADMVLTDGANQGRIWKAFRDRGMGFSASTLGEWDDSPTAAFDNPPSTGAIAGQAYWQDRDSIFVESAHPYGSNSDLYFNVSGPSNASAMRVHFLFYDFESGYDGLLIEDAGGNVYDEITGTKYDAWSAWVPGNLLRIHLVSDGSVEQLGFVADWLHMQRAVKKVPIALSDGDSTTTAGDGTFGFSNKAPNNYLAEAPWIFQPSQQNAPVSKGVTTVINFAANALWGLAFGRVNPSVGDSATQFKFKVNYLHLKNQAPTKSKVRIERKNGTLVGTSSLTTTDTTYRDGSLYRAGRSLPPGRTYRYIFKFQAGGEDKALGPQVGPMVLSDATLKNGQVNPTTGKANSTRFVFSVKYTQADNYAPEYVKVKILKSNGSLFKTLNMTTTDTTYSAGSKFKKGTKLPAGNYKFRFEAKQIDRVFRTAKKNGPSVQ